MKFIAVRTCEDCPDKNHKGGFGTVAYIPICLAVDKTLGYTTSATTDRGRVYAEYDGTIPKWCPLPELEHENA